MRWRAFLLFLLTSLASAAIPPKRIILITIDTTRADRMGFLGSNLGLTPHLDELARDAIAFSKAYSQVPLTTASHATILTGTYPQFHKVNDAGLTLAKTLPYAPALFRAKGYRTAAFVGSVILDPQGGAPGFDRGFEFYDAGFHAKKAGEDRYHSVDRRGADVISHAGQWIDKHAAFPFFVWIHLYDPHAPYDPPEPFKSKFKDKPYDGEIAYTDSALGELFDRLRQAKLYDGTVIVVAADHGEGLGEHGERGHGIFLYDSTIHVPLLLKMPAQRDAGQKVDNRVELVDVLPTLLSIAEIPVPKAVQGRSLLPPADKDKGQQSAAEANDRPAYSETDYPYKAYGWSALRSLRANKYLFVEAPRDELYDQSSDPSEAHNLASTSAAVRDELNEKLDKFRSQTASNLTTAHAEVSADQQAKLRALGYVSGSAPASRSNETLADPKDKIELANRMTEANIALEDGRNEEAVATLKSVIESDPKISAAYAALGTTLLHQHDFKGAIPVLRKSAELQPDSSWAHYQLGIALYQTGDSAAAAPELEAAVKSSPQSGEMRYAFASVLLRANRVDEAKAQLRKVLQLKPGDFDASLMMGFILTVQQQAAAALPFLQSAAKARPKAPDPHRYMVQAYTLLGQKANADAEQAQAEKLSSSQ